MVTYETLATYLDMVRKAYGNTIASLAEARDLVERLKLDEAKQQGQIFTLESLMNIEENPPIVEMPLVEEGVMAEEHDKRLDFFEQGTPEEFFEERKEVTYKQEAEDTARAVDALNNEENV